MLEHQCCEWFLKDLKARSIKIDPTDISTHLALCPRFKVEINAMQRRVNHQETIRSIVRSIKSDVIEGDGWNLKDVT